MAAGRRRGQVCRGSALSLGAHQGLASAGGLPSVQLRPWVGPGAFQSPSPTGSSHGRPQGCGTIRLMLWGPRQGPGGGEGEAEEP